MPSRRSVGHGDSLRQWGAKCLETTPEAHYLWRQYVI
jgi:hypothetical protein